MSIEYQLYSMSITNNIIIPIVATIPHPQHQNVFSPIPFRNTPTKTSIFTEILPWRKSISAFRKFKIKKDKKEKMELMDIDINQPLLELCKQQYVKLMKNKNREVTVNSQTKLYDENQPPFAYYDPNAAPLYQLDHNESIEVPSRSARNSLPVQAMNEEIQQIRIQRIQSQIIDEEIIPPNYIEPRLDDPFIILRKDNPKKNQKHNKTKLIKKEKEKGARAKDEEITGRTCNSPSKNKQNRVSQDHAKTQQLTVTHKDFINSANIYSHKQEESDSDSDDNQSSDSPIHPMKKQIHSLKQIVEQAHSKHFIQSTKIKHRQNLMTPIKVFERCLQVSDM